MGARKRSSPPVLPTTVGHGPAGRRAHHTRLPGAGGVMVLELDAAGASSATEEGAGALKRRLEDAIDGAMARMSEPEWAPFRPGTSYFASPRPAGATLGLLELVTRGGGIGVLPPMLSDDEARVVASSSRGYPCSAHFVDGGRRPQIPHFLLSLPSSIAFGW
ncbi:hypothetical protein D1007_24127 [Hordeum vulgare]|nr:hypothetical protein D1007_24127 [Hordeum vulgare]